METETSEKGGGKITIATEPSTLIIDSETALQREAEFEEMFKDRYSDKDEDFVSTLANPPPPPPVVPNFYSRPKSGRYDRSRHDNRRDGGSHGDRGRRDDYRGDRRSDHRNDRSRYHPYKNRDDNNAYRIRYDDRY